MRVRGPVRVLEVYSERCRFSIEETVRSSLFILSIVVDVLLLCAWSRNGCQEQVLMGITIAAGRVFRELFEKAQARIYRCKTSCCWLVSCGKERDHEQWNVKHGIVYLTS